MSRDPGRGVLNQEGRKSGCLPGRETRRFLTRAQEVRLASDGSLLRVREQVRVCGYPARFLFTLASLSAQRWNTRGDIRDELSMFILNSERYQPFVIGKEEPEPTRYRVNRRDRFSLNINDIEIAKATT